jgi:3-keto-disaccharide hydrolase
MRNVAVSIALLTLLVSTTWAQQETKLPLDSAEGLQGVNGTAQAASYHGRRAVKLVPAAGQENTDGSMMAMVKGADFKDGTIELDVAGAPRAGAPADMRGFIGIAFRVQGANREETIYLRPTNARCDDQLRRNHTLQYASDPDYPWYRLRKENPGVYESYADMQAGEWTHIKVVVAGTKAQLYVNGADQPALIVNDLKLGDGRGQIALWAHVTTEAYFSNLSIK